MGTVTQVAFPGLSDHVFEINRMAFSLFGLEVYWYGILIALGFGLAILYVFRRIKAFGLNSDRFLDGVMVGALAGIVGARLYYVAFRWDYYSQHLGKLFDTRSGGLAIYGGIIAGFLAGILMCRLRKVRVLPALDAVSGGFLIGQAIGRWGNFINVEAFGGPTSLPWGMASPKIFSYLLENQAALQQQGMDIALDAAADWQSVTVHPTFFYESIWCLLGFILVALFSKRRRFDGEVGLFYIAWYGAGRAVIEGLRTDSLLIPGTVLRVSQVLAVCCVLGAAFVWFLMLKRTRGRNIPLYVTTEESALAVSGALYPSKKKKGEKPAPAETESPSKDSGSEKGGC